MIIGDKSPDGMIYAGISPETQRSFYVCAQDAPNEMEWGKAMEYAAEKGMILPTLAELGVMYRYRNKIGGFGDKVYWTSMEYNNLVAWLQNFIDGSQYYYSKKYALAVRCARR